MTTRILLTGANGQLGWELQRTRPEGMELHPMTSAELDITHAQAVMERVQAIQPHWIINAAAYTAVDKAESEPERAHAVNEHGARYLAEAARAVGARMTHISTDFVFDGEQGHPYKPNDATAPLGVYGSSKRAGELAVRQALNPSEIVIASEAKQSMPHPGSPLRFAPKSAVENGARLQSRPEGGREGLPGIRDDESLSHTTGLDRALIIRTAWVYSTHGNNFVKTMLRLMREREQLGIVADQIGSPTWARGLAQALWQAIALDLKGVHHWTDAGVASWYDFACAIHEEARALGLLERDVLIRPIRTEDYPTPARRPAYSVLDKTATWQALGITSPAHWRAQLRAMLHDFKENK